MPRFVMQCAAAKHATPSIYQITVLRKSEQDLSRVLCPVCKEPMHRVAQGVSTRIVEVLDNGLMPRRVERLADAERLFKERSDADKKR